jgi:hypothetical protein
LRRHGLTPFRRILTPDDFRAAHAGSPPPKTILIPEVVFWLMATTTLAGESMAAGVLQFWQTMRAALPQLPLAPVTEEAFCLARAALPQRFFRRLFGQVVQRFEQRFAAPLLWQGRRLLALDGTEVNLPAHPKVRRDFPPQLHRHGTPGPAQARLVGLVGLWSGLCHAFRFTPLGVCEQASARRLLHYLRPGDLLLADRNFPDQATFAGVLARQADFLFRLPANRYLNRTRLATPAGDDRQWYIEVVLGRSTAPQRLRILQYQRPGFRPSWLITSLHDTVTFSYDQLVLLYHERWRQETFHREWKHSLALAHLRSHHAAGLRKEVLVQLTFNNLVRWLMAEAAPPPQRPVDLQFRAAKRLILASLSAMAVAPARLLPDLYNNLLLQIAHGRIRVRPGRSYPRAFDHLPRPKGHGRTAQPARLATPVPI